MYKKITLITFIFLLSIIKISFAETILLKKNSYIKVLKKTDLYEDVTGNITVDEALANEIYELKGITKTRFKILISTGAYRSISKKSSKIINSDLKINLPGVTEQKKLYKDLVKAQDCSSFVAEKDYPLNGYADKTKFKVQNIYKSLLSDQFQINAFRKNNITFNSFLCRKILLNGLTYSWEMPEIDKTNCY